MRIPLATLLVALAGSPLVGSPLAAQSIIGTVVDEADETPLAGVRLVLEDPEGAAVAETVSDEEGRFALDVPAAGSWVVTGDLIGYGDMRSEPVEVDLGEQVRVRIRMAVRALALEPLVVTGRMSSMNGDLRAFYTRMERGSRSGLGAFISREDIEQRGPLHPTDLFRGQASVRIVRGLRGRGAGLRMSGGCVPAVFIDGSLINRFNPYDSLDDYVAVQSIEGVEIYRGAASQVGRFHDPRGCGLILVWTRRGEPDEGDAPFSWTKLALGLGLIGALFLLK